MMSGHDMWSSSWMWVFVPLALALAVALVVLLVGAFSAQTGEGAGGPVGPRRSGLGPTAIAVAVLVVATVAVAVAASRSATPWSAANAEPTCSAPRPPGSTVEVTLADMGGMMGGRMPTWRNGQLMPGAGLGMMSGGMMGGSATYGRIMSVMVSPMSAPAGDVSLRVWNAGTIVHELVVMPMPPGGPGSRIVGSDGKVAEDGSLGEASASCGKGAGDGIQSGAASWVTLHLAAGRYELICNIAGHYSMGMFTEFDVA